MDLVRRVYVAAPYRRHPAARAAHAVLTAAGLEPTSRWCVMAEHGVDDAVSAFAIDRADLARSDALLALLEEPGGKETYCEIEVARATGIPIAWIGDNTPMSLKYTTIASRGDLARGFADGEIGSAVEWLRAQPTIDPPALHPLTAAALAGVSLERAAQDLKWKRVPGVWTNDAGIKLAVLVDAVLVEEVGEVARAVLERAPLEHLRAELIQVAAVAVAWAECVDAGTERHREIVVDDQEARATHEREKS